MKILCGLLLLLAAGILSIVAFAQQTTYEGCPAYDATTPVSPEVAALAKLPISEKGYAIRRKPARSQKLIVRRRHLRRVRSR